MANKIRENYRTFMDVGEGHHRRRRTEERGEFIHKIPDGSARGLTRVEFCRKIVAVDVQASREEAYFLGLGLKVLILWFQENEIEHGDASLDEFDLMFPAIADVLAFDLPIEPAGEQMIDRSALWKAFGPRMVFCVQFIPEGGRAAAPVGIGKSKELAGRRSLGIGPIQRNRASASV